MAKKSKVHVNHDLPANLKPAERRKLVAQLRYLSSEKITQKEIAQALKVDSSTVSRDVHSSEYQDECILIQDTLKGDAYTLAWSTIISDGLRNKKQAVRLLTAKWMIERFNLATFDDGRLSKAPWE